MQDTNLKVTLDNNEQKMLFPLSMDKNFKDTKGSRKETETGNSKEEKKTEKEVRIKYVNREQLILRPTNVEDLIPEDHPARAIWEFTGRLNLSKFHATIGSVIGVAGRPVYDPRLLIALWLYAYSCGIGSAREIARKCKTDSAFQWLCGFMEISYHTLSDFRVGYKEELDELFTNVLGLLAEAGLITLERVGVDGTKIKANAGVDTYRRENRIKEYLEIARKVVKELEDPMKEDGSKRSYKAKKRAGRERKERMELALKELEKIRSQKKGEEEKKEARGSTTDPESRIMKQSDGGYAPSYNVEFGSDSKYGIIVGVEVSQDRDDYGAGIPMAEQIKERLGKYPEEYIGDGGFVTNESIIGMEERGIDFIGPIEEEDNRSIAERQYKKRGVGERFYGEAFKYDGLNNTMVCPNGKILRYDGKEERIGVTRYKYRGKWSDCKGCRDKFQCCPGNRGKGRAVEWKEYHSAVVNFKKKMATEEAKDKYKKRGQICEFTNAGIKAKIKLRQFNVRGLIKTKMEAIWAALVFNIKRWISLRWLPAFQSG